MKEERRTRKNCEKEILGEESPVGKCREMKEDLIMGGGKKNE